MAATTAENLEQLTLNNRCYRHVHQTDAYQQLVFMSLPPQSDIGMEAHDDGTQFVRVESGIGRAVINGRETVLRDGSFVMIHPGEQHNIINTSSTERLQTYVIYSPPHHPMHLHQCTKGEEREDR